MTRIQRLQELREPLKALLAVIGRLFISPKWYLFGGKSKEVEGWRRIVDGILEKIIQVSSFSSFPTFTDMYNIAPLPLLITCTARNPLHSTLLNFPRTAGTTRIPRRACCRRFSMRRTRKTQEGSPAKNSAIPSLCLCSQVGVRLHMKQQS